jgi:hypothetical protein
METFDLVIVGAIAGMIAIANPNLNPIKLDASIKQPRSIASSQLQPNQPSERGVLCTTPQKGTVHHETDESYIKKVLDLCLRFKQTLHS